MRIVIVIMIVGAVVAYLGYQEMQLASVAKQTAQEITCDDLGQKGYGENAHLKLTEFIMSPGTYVYKGDLKNTSKPWDTVWVPLLPQGGEYHKMLAGLDENTKVEHIPTPTDIRVIFKSKNIKNEAALDAVMGGKDVSGIVVNKIESLGTKEREMLQSSYKGIDFNKCWILEHGRTPAGQPQIMGMMAGGAAAVVLPGLFLFMRKKNAA